MHKFLLKFFILSLVLNFFWEILQMPLYANAGWMLRDIFSFICIHLFFATLDIVLISLAYWLTSAIARNWLWIQKLSKEWVLFGTVLIITQALIEYVFVYKLKLWSYAQLMPIIFGIGLAPLLQLLITCLLSASLPSIIKKG